MRLKPGARSANASHRAARRSSSDLATAVALRVPLGLVLLSLLFLALLPILIQSRIAGSLDELADQMDPATLALNDLQVALAQETAGTRAFLLTGDERYADSHHQAQLTRRRAYTSLVGHAAQMAPGLAADLADLGRTLDAADRLVDALYLGTVTPEDYMGHFADQHQRFQTATHTTRRLQQEIRREASERRERIRAIHRLDALLSVAAVLLALGAISAVARLSLKQRALAEREKNARAESESARAEAERRRHEVVRISASRDALIRGFSHDLRNPLGAADGYLFVLEQGIQGPLTEKQVYAVGRARRSLKVGLQLIQDLLDVARAASDHVDLHLETTDLRGIVARAADDYRGQADRKGLSMTIDSPETVQPIRSDPARVSQILGNLLSNAIKYTDRGNIVISVGNRQDAEGREWSVVDVSDTGPGIAKLDQRMIFDEFARAALPGDGSGTGIGLAIGQRLAARLGGRITVDSDFGHGATFTLWLPLVNATATSNAAPMMC